VLRPDVVLFGEMLPVDEVERLQRELVDDPPEVLLVVGTTALFPYIVEPVIRALRQGRVVLEINPEPTTISDLVSLRIPLPAGEALPELARLLA
jgi:NAD-dependent deacetylase